MIYAGSILHIHICKPLIHHRERIVKELQIFLCFILFIKHISCNFNSRPELIYGCIIYYHIWYAQLIQLSHFTLTGCQRIADQRKIRIYSQKFLCIDGAFLMRSCSFSDSRIFHLHQNVGFDTVRASDYFVTFIKHRHHMSCSGIKTRYILRIVRNLNLSAQTISYRPVCLSTAAVSSAACNGKCQHQRQYYAYYYILFLSHIYLLFRSGRIYFLTPLPSDTISATILNVFSRFSVVRTSEGLPSCAKFSPFISATLVFTPAFSR